MRNPLPGFWRAAISARCQTELKSARASLMTRPTKLSDTICVAAMSCFAITAPSWVVAKDWQSVFEIFEERCTFCHSGEFAPLGLSLDSYEGVKAGSENGPVVIGGSSQTSPLWKRVTGRAEPQMPLDGPPFLDEREISTIELWISNGAIGPIDSNAAILDA